MPPPAGNSLSRCFTSAAEASSSHCTSSRKSRIGLVFDNRRSIQAIEALISVRPDRGVAGACGMRKQNPCKGNDRPEEPAQRLADLLHLGPRRRQQVDFKVLGKRFAKGSVGNGLADRLGATSAEDRGTKPLLLQFLRQRAVQSLPRRPSCPRLASRTVPGGSNDRRESRSSDPRPDQRKETADSSGFSARRTNSWTSAGMPPPIRAWSARESLAFRLESPGTAIPGRRIASDDSRRRRDDRRRGKPQPRRIGVEQRHSRRRRENQGNKCQR